MQARQCLDRDHTDRNVSSRRAMIAWAGKFAGGAVLAAAIPAARWAEPAAAQDDAVTLTTAAGAQVSASPGSAVARSVVAEAAASRGAARVQAAGALAEAACDTGALAEGSTAFAVAVPAAGAEAQSASPSLLRRARMMPPMRDEPLRRAPPRRQQLAVEAAPTESGAEAVAVGAAADE